MMYIILNFKINIFFLFKSNENVGEIKVIENMTEMAQFVFDFYQSKLKLWNSIKSQPDKLHLNTKNKLDEEEVVLREKLNKVVTKSTLLKNLNIDSESSNSESNDDDDDDNIEMNQTENLHNLVIKNIQKETQ